MAGPYVHTPAGFKRGPVSTTVPNANCRLTTTNFPPLTSNKAKDNQPNQPAIILKIVICGKISRASQPTQQYFTEQPNIINKLTVPKQKLLLLFISVCAIWNTTKAQSYTMESLEGTKVKIHFTKTPSWYGEAFSCLADTLFLDDYAYAKEIHVLKRKFLQIDYYTRGGSNSIFRSTIILSVKRNKINASILVQSFGEAFGGDSDGSLYRIKFNITGNDTNNFKLITHIYDRHNSCEHPKTSYIKNKQVTLAFDPDQNIFYSAHKKVVQSFTIDDSKVPSEKLAVNATLPVIFLDNYSHHYYMKGVWYETGESDRLFKSYSK